MWTEFRVAIQRIIAAALFFAVKLALAGLMVLADLGLKELSTLVLEPEGAPYKIIEVVLNVTFVGGATVIAGAGVVVVVYEVIRSSINYLGRE